MDRGTPEEGHSRPSESTGAVLAEVRQEPAIIQNRCRSLLLYEYLRLTEDLEELKPEPPPPIAE
jgi:hypothetical protein